MSKTVIIIDNEPYTRARAQSFFVKDMLADGFVVKYFSLAKINLVKNSAVYPSYESNELTIYPESIGEFIRYLQVLPLQSKAILEIEKNYKTLPVFKTLCELDFVTIRIDYFGSLNAVLKQRRDEKIPFHILIKNWLTHKMHQLYFRKIDSYAKSYKFLTGKARNTNTVSLNYFDFEKDQNPEYVKKFKSINYAVFLDSSIVNHPDFQLRDNTFNINEDLYYERINGFLDKVSSFYGLQIKIALHPKSSGHQFKFETYKGCTLELVNNADLMINHASYSCLTGLAKHKPIIFLYSDKLFAHPSLLKHKRGIFNFAEALDAKLFNVDEDVEKSDLKDTNADRKKTELFLNNYVFAETKSKNYTKLKEVLLHD